MASAIPACSGVGSQVPRTSLDWSSLPALHSIASSSQFINKERIHIGRLGLLRRRVERHGGSRKRTVRGVLTEKSSRLVQSKEEGEGGRPEMGLTDSSLVSTLMHRLWLGFGASAVSGMIVKGALAANTLSDVGGIGFGALAAYVLADLGTGVYHWGIDNYGDVKTPVFGSQIDAFQGHHKRPWTITKREFANNLHALARPAGFFLLPFLALPSNPALDTFLGVFLGLVVMSQQIHAWAHSKESRLPPVVRYLQKHGVLVNRKMHGAHHRSPYSINYCIVSGLWNPILDESRFFPRLEVVIYSRWGVAPRNWADTAPEWLQEGSYFEDGSDIKLGQSDFN